MSLQDLLILNERYEELGKEITKLKAEKDKAISIIKGIRDYGDNYDFGIMYDFLDQVGDKDE